MIIINVIINIIIVSRCVDSMRRTSVHYAATCKDESAREIIIELLVQAGVDPEAR